MGPSQESAYKMAKDGWALYEVKEYYSALAKFNSAVRLNPNYADAYNGLGWTHFALHDIQQAIFQFSKGVEKDRRLIDIPVGYTFALYENGNYSIENGALKWALEAIKIDTAEFDMDGLDYYFIHNSKVTAKEFREVMALSYFYLGKFMDSYGILRKYLNGQEIDTLSSEFASNLLKELNRICNE